MQNLTPDNLVVISAREKMQLPQGVQPDISPMVGGWQATQNELRKGNVSIKAREEQILLGSATSPTSGVGIFIGKNGSDYEFRAGDPAGEYILWDGSALTISGINVAQDVFGDGSDGAVTISADTTLARDMYYSSLTVNTTKVLNTGGYKIFVSGTLTNNGTIRNNGSVAVTSTGGAGAPGKTVRGGANGSGNGVGGNGSGGGGGGVVFISAKTITNTSGTIQANGGNGSAGTAPGETRVGDDGLAMSAGKGGNGGAGGLATGSGVGSGAGGVVTATEQDFKNYYAASLVFDPVLAIAIGGGGGGGEGDESVGAGGSGGGGGGGGGFVLLFYQTASWGTEQALGGTLGGNYGAGGDGYDGSVGTVTKIAIT